MKNFAKRVISLFLVVLMSACMLCAGLPFTGGAEELAAASTSSAVIRSVTVIDSLVLVEYSAAEEGTLVVALYEKEGGKMLSSGDRSVSAPPEDADPVQKASFDFSEQNPGDSCYVKAFLLDEANRPVCKAVGGTVKELRADFTADEAMRVIDDAVAAMDSFREANNLASATDAERETLAARMFHELEEKKLVKNVEYHAESYTYYYDFCDLGAGIFEVKDTRSEGSFGGRDSQAAKTEFARQTASVSKTTDGKNWLFINTTEFNNEFMMDQKNEYEKLGINVTFKKNGKLLDFMDMTGYDLIYIASHGGIDVKTGSPYFTTAERILPNVKEEIFYLEADGSVKYQFDFATGGFNYLIEAGFFDKCYGKTGLSQAVVMLAVCQCAGTNNYVNSTLCRDILGAGAENVVGCVNDYNTLYAGCFYERMMISLLNGNNVGQAFAFAKAIVGNNVHEYLLKYKNSETEIQKDMPYYINSPSIPVLFPKNSDPRHSDTVLCKDFVEYGTYSCNYVDTVYQTPVGNVGVMFVPKNSIADYFEYVAPADKNGFVTCELPDGEYIVKVYSNSEDYELKVYEISIVKGADVVETDPVSLERRICRFPLNVQNKNPEIDLVKAEVNFYDDKISKTEPVLTCSSDSEEILQRLPFGDYRVVCKHPNYADFKTNISLHHDDMLMANETDLYVKDGEYYYAKDVTVIMSHFYADVIGSVADASSGEPLADAKVEITLEQDGKTYSVGSVTTGADGAFKLRVPSGKLTVKASKTVNGKTASDSVTFETGATTFTIADPLKLDLQEEEYQYIQFGTYPQSRVTDETLLAKLEAAEKTWTSYGYYSGTGLQLDGKMTAGDCMWFADFKVGKIKYRAVRIVNYRPQNTGYLRNASSSYQDENGYTTGTYYFVYEPLQWRVLDDATGYVVCEALIDSQAYQNTIYCGIKNGVRNWESSSQKRPANDYSHSSIREWLNYDFYETAFTDEQKNIIQKPATAINNDSPYHSAFNSAATNDKIYMLSYSDVTNTAYGFNASPSAYDPARYAAGTDYAKCQGLQTVRNSTGMYSSTWWLRSPGDDGDACTVENGGNADKKYYVNFTRFGVRPACCLSDLASDISLSDTLFSQMKSGVKKSAPAPRNVASTNTLTLDASLTVQTVIRNSGDVSLTASRADAVAGEEYVLLVVKDENAEHLLSADNLLYIEQQTAAGETVTFSYLSREEVPGAAARIYGPVNGSHVHQFGAWTVTKPATAAEEGVETRVCTVCGYAETLTVAKIEQTFAPGDVNGDNKVGSDDSRLALRASVGLEQYAAGSAEFFAADVNRDNKIGSDDARLILRASVGLEDAKTWGK